MAHTTNISSPGIQHLQLSVKDYHRYKRGNSEISFKGKLYDIKQVTLFTENVELLVLDDICEEEIVEEIVKTIKKYSPQTRRLPLPLVELMGMEYLLPVIEGIQPIHLLAERRFQAFAFFISPIDIGTSSPPPRMA